MKYINYNFDEKYLHKMLNCPICNSKSFFIFTSKHSRAIYECSNKDCNHFFTPFYSENQGIVPREDNIEKISDEYLRIYYERNKKLLKLFQSKLKNNDFPTTFLDYGAGSAHVSRTFRELLNNKARIYCLEKNSDFYNFYQKYELTYIKDLKELDKKIDFIYLIEVIEHLKDPIETMKQLSKFLNKNGLIFISTPLGTKIENETNAYDTSSHIHFFSKKSFNLMLKKSGFTEIIFKYYPEMYPKSSNKYIEIKMSIKNLILNSFLKSVFPKIVINHLVGFTRPISIKSNQ